MKIKAVYKVLPAFIFYTDRFVKRRFDAMAFGPLVFIRPSFRDSKSLLVHEVVHVKQFYRYLGLNGLLYLFSKKMRLKLELEAYKEQLKVVDESKRQRKTERAALFISEKYNLDISCEDVLKQLTED